MINIARIHLKDPRAELECYWEYATLHPEKVMDEFDTRMASLCANLTGDPIVLDMTAVPSPIIRCAARFGEGGVSTVREVLPLQLMICNMSPLVLSPSAITIRFTNYAVNDVIIGPPSSGDILPGTVADLFGLVQPLFQGSLSVCPITFSRLTF